MSNYFLFLTLIIVNSTAMKAMELTTSQPKRTVPTLKTITEKYLIHHKDKNIHPCAHMDKLLSEPMCDDIKDDLKKQFLTKYAIYGMHQKCKSTKIYDSCVEKSVVTNNGDRVYFLSDAHNRVIIELDTESNTIIGQTQGHQGCINDLIKHQEILISGSSDQTIKLWNPKTHECLQTINNEDDIVCLASENTDIFCNLSKETITIYDIASSTPVTSRHAYLSNHNECILNNGILYTRQEGNLLQWDLRTKSLILHEKIKDIEGITCHSSMPNVLFSGSYKGGVRKWDMRNTNKPIQIFNTRPVTTIKIDKDLLFIALSAPFAFGGGQGQASKDQEHPGIKIWDLKNNEEIGTLPGNGYIFNLETHDSGLYVSSSGCLLKHGSSSYDNSYKALQDVDFTTMDNENQIYSKDIQEDNINCVVS